MSPPAEFGPKLLELRRISKSFPGVRALQEVVLEVHQGEVLGLAGENGAGKSTLIKIIAGIALPDEGEILFEGRRVQIRSVRDSMRLGISSIHQELSLAENLDIAENIFLGQQPYRGPRWLPLTQRRELRLRCGQLLDRVGLRVPCTTLVNRLSFGQKQLVAIAKALSTEARLMIFDEPTSSLTDTEAKRLLQTVVSLKQAGVGIIYVTHRLAELTELADRVLVLRDGRQVGALAKDELHHERIVSLMVGRNLDQFYHRQHHQGGQAEVLRVEGLCYAGAKEPVGFAIRQGEIVGFAGLMGAGRTELARALFGIDRAAAGSVWVAGRELRPRTPQKAIAAGMLLVPEDRKTQGLILQASVGANLCLAAMPALGRWGVRNRTAETALGVRQIESLQIRAADLEQKAMLLSGGNQQKVVLGKWLAMQPKVLILDEPTRGVDVGAKSEIYGLISALAEQGVGVMLISSEMEEVIAMSDRVIVMHEGRLQGELAPQAVTEENIMTLAVGKEL